MHTVLNEFKLEEWNERWSSLNEAKQTKLWFPRIDKALSKDLLKLTRVSLGQIIGFISGHNHLLRTQRKVYNNPYTDVTCRACKEPGTTGRRFPLMVDVQSTKTHKEHSSWMARGQWWKRRTHRIKPTDVSSRFKFRDCLDQTWTANTREPLSMVAWTA